MANLRRRQTEKVAKGGSYKTNMAAHFNSDRMIAEWEQLLAAAKEKADLRTWQQALVSIENRTEGRPAQAVEREKADISVLLAAVRDAAERGGFIDAIAVDKGVADDGESGSGRLPGDAEPSGVSEDVLAAGQLPSEPGTDGVPRLPGED